MEKNSALKLLEEYVSNDRLIKHMIAVSASLKYYAEKIKSGEIVIPNNIEDVTTINPEEWELAGLLHDADWEKFPDVHPAYIVHHLQTLGIGENIVNAIWSHADKDWFVRNNYPIEVNFDYQGNTVSKTRAIERKSLLDKMLFACDEMSGMVYAVSLMRPDKLETLEPSSVMKKIKDKNFAKGVDRNDLEISIKYIGLTYEEHIKNIIEALKNSSNLLY